MLQHNTFEMKEIWLGLIFAVYLDKRAQTACECFALTG